MTNITQVRVCLRHTSTHVRNTFSVVNNKSRHKYRSMELFVVTTSRCLTRVEARFITTLCAASGPSVSWTAKDPDAMSWSTKCWCTRHRSPWEYLPSPPTFLSSDVSSVSLTSSLYHKRHQVRMWNKRKYVCQINTSTFVNSIQVRMVLENLSFGVKLFSPRVLIVWNARNTTM